MGRITGVIPEGPGKKLLVMPPADLMAGTRIGDSVAINGCCLTVVAAHDRGWTFEAGPETLARTNLGRLVPGQRVNLERALAADARLGGHFVQGHIDGCGTVESILVDGQWTTLWFATAGELTRQMVSKGSVAVDGVSLTLVEVGEGRFSVALIPHTLEVTTLGARRVGDRVNIESDILAKYVGKLLAR